MSNFVWGVHGIWSDGSKSIDRLGRALWRQHGYLYQDVDYKFSNLLDQRCEQKHAANAELLASKMNDGDHVIAHSNGAGIVHTAMSMCGRRRFGVVILFAPAFDCDVAWPAGKFKKLVIIKNPYDVVLLFGQSLWWHRFGSLGRTGYCGPDDFRIVDVEKAAFFKHSDSFKSSKIHASARLAHAWIKQYG